MLGSQKSRLDDAVQEHKRALQRLESVRDNSRQQRAAFLSEPANLLFPFIAGILVSFSQIKNVPKGINRLPFMSIAKTGVGLYALVSRLQNSRAQESEEDKLV